jgi:dihydrodipicolinate reductase
VRFRVFEGSNVIVVICINSSIQCFFVFIFVGNVVKFFGAKLDVEIVVVR